MILSFFVFIIIYAIIVIAYLVNLLTPYEDVYTDGVVISICIKQIQLTGNVYSDSEVTIKVKEDIRSCYAKFFFLLGKINNVIVSLVLLGLFTDRNDAFSYPFIYFS